MSKQLHSGLVRRLGLAAILVVAGSSAALAFGFVPGSWKVVDGGKTVRKRVGGLQYALIQNNGPDAIHASSKGKFKTSEGDLLPGTKATLIVPKGAKNVKLVDANFGNGKGSKGTLIWSQKLGAGGQVIDTKPNQ